MIRNEKEYQEAVRRLQSERERIENHRKKLTDEMGLGADEAKRVIDPMVSFHQQLAEEVESYERLKRGPSPLIEAMQSSMMTACFDKAPRNAGI